MLSMRPNTYIWLTNSLLVASLSLMLGSTAVACTGWLDHADFLLRLAVMPGGFIMGGLVYLVNGCIEHYADLLPPCYRARASTRSEWQALYGSERMAAVEAALKDFAVLYGVRPSDAFQFRPDDNIEDLLQAFHAGGTISGDHPCATPAPTRPESVAEASLRAYLDTTIAVKQGL